MQKKAIIAMSGGVDSSVAAHLMKQKGYDCLGVTMRLYDKENMDSDGSSETDAKEACGCGDICGCQKEFVSKDIQDAKKVADAVGIPFEVWDYREEFDRDVIKHFVETYVKGDTPNPCVECNHYIKFGKMMDETFARGYDILATGHYVRNEYDEATGRYLLKKAVDLSKDQSYMLFNLTQEQLSHIEFPLGGFSKDEIRQMAGQQELVNAQKRDSQDICFVPDGKYAEFIEDYLGTTFEKGEFVTTEGEVLGEHQGMIRYTLGQRRGLGISAAARLYVVDKDMENNRVILGSNEDLMSDTLVADQVNLISIDKITEPIRCTAKVRYKHKEAAATVTQISEDQIKVVFDQPQRGITPGQAVVLYDGDVVIGGGVIR